MQVSVMGLVVCIGIFLAAYRNGGVLIVGLIASLAFGATAVVSLSSLGGSSPLIYVMFAMLAICAAAMRRHIWTDLGNVFGKVRPIWVLSSLMVYAVIGCWLFPRLFAGQTTVFVQGKVRGGVVETSLGPVGSNITQTGYLVLGGLTAIALCVLLTNKNRMEHVRNGFLAWVTLHTAMGLIDFAAKLTGVGDVLEPIRTANYSMLTDVSVSNFVRIAGAYSEASAFGGVSLSCLAFTYTYWRRSGSRMAMWLTATLLPLTILSTSSTAYAGLAVLSVPIALVLMWAFLSNRVEKADLLLILFGACGVFAVLAAVLYRPSTFDPFVRLLDEMVFNKASSASGQERMYWNIKSLQSVSDTGGLGIGMGSSRASSWAIAVISQLGLIGSLMMAILVGYIARGLGRLEPFVPRQTADIVASVRNCALAGLVAGSLVGGTADPGMTFFIVLAVIASARVQARRNRSNEFAIRSFHPDFRDAPATPGSPIGRPGIRARA